MQFLAELIFYATERSYIKLPSPCTLLGSKDVTKIPVQLK